MALSTFNRYKTQFLAGGAVALAYVYYRTLQHPPVLAQPAPARDLDAAWAELDGAVTDAARHAQYLEDELQRVLQDKRLLQDPRMATVFNAITLDARGHAAFVASEVAAFGRLAGYEASRIPKAAGHPFSGPPSSSKLA